MKWRYGPSQVFESWLKWLRLSALIRTFVIARWSCLAHPDVVAFGWVCSEPRPGVGALNGSARDYGSSAIDVAKHLRSSPSVEIAHSR